MLRLLFVFIATVMGVRSQLVLAGDFWLDPHSQQVLVVPPLSPGEPAAGKRVAVSPPEYAGTSVFHTLYLPPDWTKDGDTIPIIFEYTGNFFPPSGSTGEPQDAALGYGLSGGKYIWVSLPYVNEDGTDNAVTWWGDAQATVDYAKQNVPRIIHDYHADPNAVLLCGFSRGAIGVNFIGLHDDQIAGLWSGFISHDHFDGVKPWAKTTWGFPLEKYREDALVRLQRVGDRPYLVSQNGSTRSTEQYVHSAIADVSNFTFSYVNTAEVLGGFPNEDAKSSHTDRWPLKPSLYRQKAWGWMNGVTKARPPESLSAN